MITFKLPNQLRDMANGQKTVAVEAASLADAFLRLDEIAPMIRSQVLHESGDVRSFVGIFVNSEQVTSLGEGARALAPGSHISIVMAVAGG